MNATILPSATHKSTARPTRDVDASIHRRLQRVNRLGDWLDTAIRVPGTNYNIGWDTIIGLAPGIGDFVTAAMSAWIINEARQLGVSKFTLARMIANTGLDAVIGAVPVAGDLFDAAFKANVKNLKLLRKSLRKRGLITDEQAASVSVVGQ